MHASAALFGCHADIWTCLGLQSADSPASWSKGSESTPAEIRIDRCRDLTSHSQSVQTTTRVGLHLAQRRTLNVRFVSLAKTQLQHCHEHTVRSGETSRVAYGSHKHGEDADLRPPCVSVPRMRISIHQCPASSEARTRIPPYHGCSK